jgi:hypothetical protein
MPERLLEPQIHADTRRVRTKHNEGLWFTPELIDFDVPIRRLDLDFICVYPPLSAVKKRF